MIFAMNKDFNFLINFLRNLQVLFTKFKILNIRYNDRIKYNCYE